MSKFDKKNFDNASKKYKLVLDSVECAAVLKANYVAQNKRASTKQFVVLYPFVRYNNATGEVEELAEVYVYSQSFQDDTPSRRRNGSAFSAEVSITLKVSSMTGMEDTMKGIDLDETFGELLYPQLDSMAGYAVLSTDHLLAIHGQEYVDKLKNSNRWGSQPQFLAAPSKTKRGVVITDRS